MFLKMGLLIGEVFGGLKPRYQKESRVLKDRQNALKGG
jgi:hypothetical protein